MVCQGKFILQSLILDISAHILHYIYVIIKIRLMTLVFKIKNFIFRPGAHKKKFESEDLMLEIMQLNPSITEIRELCYKHG